jgi:hypothetical protein
MRRAVAEVVEFVGVSVEIKELRAKVLVVDVLPSRRPDHEGPRLVRGQPEVQPRRTKGVVQFAEGSVTPGDGALSRTQQR